ncbi:uncharacterized protein LOC106763625 [Vigna radiata var. radiata]|uniref:Uncharacterized protein LOC106763625 n=1 Tax=Vigna radiata var. radiata TaxID=3916 RepID=A0A1S3UB71_VIGRR|nr:uncharacterized protein LOC106763625 [Vigna radiata var. radiata]
MVLSWIIKTLSSQIVESVIYVEDAKELWDELKERFSKGDYFKISYLLQEIHSIKQGERTLSQYFTDLKILWEELESLRPIPCCTCKVPCSYDLSKTFHNYREVEHVVCFLKRLNDYYNTVRTHILLMEPLPSINRVFSFIMQQESYDSIDDPNLVENGKNSQNTTENTNSSTNSANPMENEEVHNQRRSNRIERTPEYLKDYIHEADQSSPTSLPTSLFIKNGLKTPYPISNILSYGSLSEKYLKYTLAITASSEPNTYEEARNSLEWTNAM